MTLGLEQADMDDIVDIMNEFRDDIASGTAMDASGNALPKATDMAELRRSPDLECSALRWINVYSIFLNSFLQFTNHLSNKRKLQLLRQNQVLPMVTHLLPRQKLQQRQQHLPALLLLQQTILRRRTCHYPILGQSNQSQLRQN